LLSSAVSLSSTQKLYLNTSYFDVTILGES
jgi:hypothetical protein